MERNFHHPYEPYPIQKQFMNAVFDCLEERKELYFPPFSSSMAFVLETSAELGTKSDVRRRKFESDIGADVADADEPEWMVEHVRTEKRCAALERKKELEKKYARIREREERARVRFESGEPPRKRQRTDGDGKKVDDDVEAEFLLDDYDSDDDRENSANAQKSSTLALSVETQALMEKLGMSATTTKEDQDFEIEDELKVFFCSRTHSQLSQFVNELRRVKIPPAIQDSAQENGGQDANGDITEGIKHVTLGSRKNLCINPKVSKLGSVAAINERCLELQQSGMPQESKCSFLPNKENEVLVNDFRDHALAEIRDIEDFGKLGKRIGICPYYASRAAVKPTEIVTLPYPLLLQKAAREALGLSVKDHVVIIDEAHNLMDAIASINSTSVSQTQLEQARAQLAIYLQKFRNRLKGKNRVYVTQLVRLIDSLTNYLASKVSTTGTLEGVAQVGEMMSGKGVDQINLYKLLVYMQESKLARKVDGYSVYAEASQQPKERDIQAAKGKGKSSTTPVLSQVQTFLAALMNPEAEGRFFWSRAESTEAATVQLKYLLLDPTQHFKDLVGDARAVILAGGTMSPMSDYTNHLFHYLPLERIKTLSCGHVIPPSNLLAMPVANGPSGVEFDFTFESRQSENMILELGRAILQVVHVIPDGVVVFFPSYAYLDSAVSLWRRAKASSTSTQTFYEALASQKPIFSEAKAGPSQNSKAQTQQPAPELENVSTAETVLAAYTAQITSHAGRGALLLAVIGGSLSEGINFSDRLGRGIIVVGLPFPNPNSPEWKAKLEFVEQRSRIGAQGTPSAHAGRGKDAAREFYENACMRAVNQSVGRAIRHRADYAAIMLFDRRYSREGIRGKLPGWIQQSVRVAATFSESVESLKTFFDGRNA